MGRARFRLLAVCVLVACGSRTELSDDTDAEQDVATHDATAPNDATIDATPTDASPSDVITIPELVSCLSGGFVISGETQQQPGFGSVSGPATFGELADAGIARVSDDYTDAMAMTFDFVPITGGVSGVTSAEGVPNVLAACVSCVCLPAEYSMTMTADAGAIVYSNGVAFVTATGLTQASVPCGDASVQATTWAVCQDAGAAPPAQPTNVPFATGTHACQATLATSWPNGNGVAADQQDSISIVQNGAKLTVDYDAHTIGSGTLTFDVVTESVAIASSNQEVTLPCPGFDEGSGVMPVTAATLVVEGSAIIFSVSGTMGANTACNATTQALVLACSP
jgi:hypothetical protein